MPKISPFPYDKLQKYSLEGVQLKKKLLNAYYFFESHTEILDELVKPLEEILKTKLEIKITHLESSNLEEFVQSLPNKTLIGLVGLEPHGKKVVILFETLLAKLLVYKILSGGHVDLEKISQMQLKPLTSLEEAVVQYILISVIEQISTTITPKNFSLAYEDILTDSKKLLGSFSHQERFAIFSIKIHLYERDFFLKMALPITVAEDLGITQFNEDFAKERLKQFSKFMVNLQLEVAHVSLEPADIDQLHLGDIVMFDDTSVELDDNKITGHAMMKLADQETNEGYLVDLEVKGDFIHAKVKSSL